MPNQLPLLNQENSPYTVSYDQDERVAYLERRRKRLADAALRAIEGFPIGDDQAILALAYPARGIFYLLQDDNQNIYQTATELPDGMESFWLWYNVRNTQHIHRTVLAFYRSSVTPTAKGPAGRPPEVYSYADEQALHRLTAQEGIVISRPRISSS